MSKLLERLNAIHNQPLDPLWKGPCSEDPNGGITQSMLNQFLVCRERFRIKYILGLQAADTFSNRLEYGQMWHACEQGLAERSSDQWERLNQVTVSLCERYPLQQSEIMHWYEICKLQFPIYREYWAKHPDVQNRTPLMQEEVFNIPYKLPSGRTVRLRGKFDSVDLIDGGIWLQENKTKGDIDPQLLQRQLTFDLQTGVYLVALQCSEHVHKDKPLWKYGCEQVAGVRYNVIRRPLAGGKGSIRLKKNQTQEEYYEELSNLIKGATGPEWGVLPDEHYYFMRWKVAFTPQDIETFKQQFLNPVLEQLCDWWEWISKCGDNPFSQNDGCETTLREHTVFSSVHFRAPYGIYSPLYDGKPTDVDEYLATGSTVGLRRADSLFRELK